MRWRVRREVAWVRRRGLSQVAHSLAGRWLSLIRRFGSCEEAHRKVSATARILKGDQKNLYLGAKLRKEINEYNKLVKLKNKQFSHIYLNHYCLFFIQIFVI